MTTPENLETDAAPTPPKPQGWWRRNGVALAASVVLAGGLAFLTTSAEYGEYYGHRASQPERAAPGETLELGGTTFTLVDVERLYPSGLPRGGAGLRVTVEVAAAPGGGLPSGCVIRIAESGGTHGDRTWNSASISTADFLPVAGTESYCPSEPTGDYTLAVPFIVPDDVDGTLTLAIEVVEALPSFAALELGPLP